MPLTTSRLRKRASFRVTQHRTTRWRHLAEAFTEMTAAPDAAALAASIEDAVVRTLDAGACVFLVFDQTADQVVFEAPRRRRNHRKPASETDGLAPWMAAWTAPTVIADSRTVAWTRRVRPDEAMIGHPAMIVPVFVDPALSGLLVVFSRSAETAFSEEDMTFAQALARHAGLAVKHTLLYESARHEMASRTVLYEVGKRISSSLDLEEVLNLIIDSLQSVIPYDAAVIFLLDKAHQTIEMQTVRGYAESAIMDMHMKVGEGISGWAAKTGHGVIVPDVRQDDRYVNLRPTARSEMAVPLARGREIIGVFNIESDRVAAYDEQDMALLEAFASQATIAIENARLYRESLKTKQLEKELEVAGEIQRTLMPRWVPTVPGLSVAVLSRPSAAVGGDFYDVISFADKYLGFAVGDVVGKGVPGAIMMASLYTAFHEYATDTLMTASDVMTRVNAMLHEVTAPDRFATLFYGVLSMKDGTFRYCNAGHNPPILCRRDGSVAYLQAGGLVLGPFSSAQYELGETELSEGDVLVLYTDGVTEAQNDEQEEFGLERLEQVIKTCPGPGLSANALKECLDRTLREFVGDTPQHDDITVIILKVDKEFRQEFVVL